MIGLAIIWNNYDVQAIFESNVIHNFRNKEKFQFVNTYIFFMQYAQCSLRGQQMRIKEVVLEELGTDRDMCLLE